MFKYVPKVPPQHAYLPIEIELRKLEKSSYLDEFQQKLQGFYSDERYQQPPQQQEDPATVLAKSKSSKTKQEIDELINRTAVALRELESCKRLLWISSGPDLANLFKKYLREDQQYLTFSNFESMLVRLGLFFNH